MNRPLQQGLLASGEVRHCREWEFSPPPRLGTPGALTSTNEIIYRRQKAFAPRVLPRRTLMQRMFDVLRTP